MRLASFFAGIGGFDLGFSCHGGNPALLVENAPAARAVIDARFPHVEVLSDVRDVDALKKIDVLTAGFPCQDLSSVGQKRGIGGSRSRLIGEVFRVLENNSVPWLVLENVPFIRHLDGGNALGLITSSLEELGYSWAYRVLDAQAFGLPQRRRRWILVAARSGVGDPRDVLLAGDVPEAAPRDHREVACGFYWTEGMRALGWAVDAIPPLKAGSTVGVASPPAIRMPNGRIVLPDIRDAERLQGFAADWTLPAQDVVKAGFRWQLVGNAIPVPLASWVASRVVGGGQEYDAARDCERSGAQWPSAAWSQGDGNVFVSSAGTWPVAVGHEPLADFLQFPPSDLSVRAALGFLRRARRGSLRFPEGFLDEVVAHALAQGASLDELLDPVAA